MVFTRRSTPVVRRSGNARLATTTSRRSTTSPCRAAGRAHSSRFGGSKTERRLRAPRASAPPDSSLRNERAVTNKQTIGEEAVVLAGYVCAPMLIGHAVLPGRRGQLGV